MNHAQIETKLYTIKKWYENNYPVCIFCQRSVKRGSSQLAHKIRRSYSSMNYEKQYLITYKKNVGLSHPTCHNTFDNEPKIAIHFPGFKLIEMEIAEMEPEYYQTFKLIYNEQNSNDQKENRYRE